MVADQKLKNDDEHSPLIRVAYLFSVGFIGGAEKSMLELLSALPRDQCLAVAYVPERGEFSKALELAGVTVQVFPLPHSIEHLSRKTRWYSMFNIIWESVRYIVKLNRVLKAANIQLLHCNGLKPNILGSILCRFFGWPTVCHVRDELKGMRLRLFKRCHRWSSIHIVANSQATLRAMSISARARVVYNGMGLPDSETTLRACSKEDVKLVARKSCGLEKLNVDTPVLVAVGHLAPLKGYETFLASLVQLRPKWPKLRVFIVGGAPYVAFQEEQRRLYDLCSEWRLNEMVTWVGASSNPLGWIRSSDMVVQPSLTEGLGRTSIEAGLCSRPTVASRVGGLPEVVLDGDTGLLVPPNDPKALATAIDRLLSAPELQVSMGAEAFRHVQKKFSLSNASQATLRLYRELL